MRLSTQVVSRAFFFPNRYRGESSYPIAASVMSQSQNEWLVMVDGAARGNPGEAGCGAVIIDENGNVVKELSRYLGRTTNNVAEYEGLLMGLEALIQLGKQRVRVQSDSQLLVRQLNGEYRVKDEKLKTLFQRALTLLRQLDGYRILYVPRELNKPADRLANKGIDDAIKKSSSG
jgi:ribonuclease HI